MAGHDLVALYWDFDNIHISVAQHVVRRQRRHGEPLVDIEAIVSYVSSLGEISVNRAYANWADYREYRVSLHTSAVDTVQRFGVGAKGSKNGADIRLALDVMDDMRRFAHIETVVVVTGDSDFISLAQRCRQDGRRFVGIGVRESCSEYFVKACNEFKYYRALVMPAGAVASENSFEDPSEALPLLRRAYQQLVDRSEMAAQNIGTVKAQMKRLDPTFDESAYGAKSFTTFLHRLDSGQIRVCGIGEPGATTVELVEHGPGTNGTPPNGMAGLGDFARAYRLVLKEERIELPANGLDDFWRGVVCLYRAMEGETGGRTTAEMSQRLKDVAATEGLELSGTMRSRIVIGTLYRTELALEANDDSDRPTINVDRCEEFIDRFLHTCWSVLEAEHGQPDADIAQWTLLGPDLDVVPSIVVDRWGALLDQRCP